MRMSEGAPQGSKGPYGAFAYVYDRLMSDMPYGEWLGWLDAYWEQHGRPATIVDLGCGTGTIAIPLAQSGYDVTGVDLSEDMLAVARDKEAAARQDVHLPGRLDWQQGDMRAWSPAAPADAVISLCDCLNYLLSEEDIRLAFRSIYKSLAPGGVFLFDMHHANQLEEYMLHEPFCLDDDDVSYIWTCALDEAAATMTHRLAFFLPEEDGRYARVVETHRQRAYDEMTVRRLLAEAGFDAVASYADFTFEPIREDSTLRMFFAARREA